MDGLTAPWVIDAPMNRRIFEIYVETQLAPTLKPGDMVILDNLSSHKSEKAKPRSSRNAARGSCSSPPYSPDLNPIEMAFAKLKAHLKGTGPDHRGALAGRGLNLRALLARRMLELPQGRRICVRLNARCSKGRAPG